jgi:hydrogenase maturation protein HypF
VGFRPFVYSHAKRLGLRGFVLNSSSGVTIEIEGSGASLDGFLESLRRDPPPLAQIQETAVIELEPAGDESFEIRESRPIAGEFALVSPDMATCPDCWRDVTDPENRRFGYPFTNCTNCGPRYTIIRGIPYDRPFTTMSEFRMCPDCEREYDDPGNRRFHAQPNACASCGPTLSFAKSGSFMPGKECYGHGELSLPVLRDARDALRRGEIIAVKGLGGFHLACDAENSTAVQALRSRKKRSDKPFALMARDIGSIERFCEVSSAEHELLTGPEHPVVILRAKTGNSIATEVAPGNRTLGVMLPYTPLQYFLFGEDPNRPPEFTALVMTSGNISDEPIVISNGEAWQRLHSVADWFLFHNREIHTRVDDSLARVFGNKTCMLRRSRGYAPHPIDLVSSVPEILACGAELKNTFCLTKGQYAFPSQHIGDMDNFETLEFFEETLEKMKKLFRVEPKAVAHDLHPLYLTTRLARDLALEKIGVQHHHAHIASCMAENGVRGKVIGIAFDGTGYGTDGQIWGGEFLVADRAGFERRAHFRYVPLPGADVAVRQPWRMALSYLHDALGDSIPADLPLLQSVPEQHRQIVSTMLKRRVNTSLTSSCGRLFDAVASLLGLRQEVTFEGEAAIELETLCRPGIDQQYPFQITEGDPLQVDFRPMIKAIVRDVSCSRPAVLIASCFHNTIVAGVLDVCCRIRQLEGLDRVCLSGGSFQNWYLLERTVRVLTHAGFEVFVHSRVPPNDGGISLGQAVIAGEILQHGAATCA